MSTKKYLLLILTLLGCSRTFSQAPSIEWDKCFGGSQGDVATSVQQTTDGGYIVGGYAYSSDGQVSGNHDSLIFSCDYWLLKLNGHGNLQWKKCMGGYSDDYLNATIQTSDGGYALCGQTYSGNGDVGTGASDTFSNIWFIKMDSSANVEWKKSIGGSKTEWASTLLQTYDGGYVFTGTTKSKDGDVIGNPDTIGANQTGWMVKLDSAGGIQWQKFFTDSNLYVPQSIRVTRDSGFIIAGSIGTTIGLGCHGYGLDYWLAKLDYTGNLQWQKCYGGSSFDEATSINLTKDDGFIVAGYTKSYNGDVTGLHGSHQDYWIIKIDNSGNIEWQKCLGGSETETALSVEQTKDGGFIVAGDSYSLDGDVVGNHFPFQADGWIIKLDSTGAMQWQKCLGGNSSEIGFSIHQTSDEGYIVSSSTNSDDHDVHGHFGTTTFDYWIVKLSPDTIATTLENINDDLPITIFPNPGVNYMTINSMGKQLEQVIIYSIEGNQVMEIKKTINSFTVNTESFPIGIYIIAMSAKGKIERLKWIKI